MWFTALLWRLLPGWRTTRPARCRRSKKSPRRSFVPCLDVLEDRTVLSTVSFSPAVNYGALSNPDSVAVGDFNADGKPDLATVSLSSNSVSVLLGNGDGTFQPARSFSVGSSPRSVAVGDFNGDGKPDLAVANENSNSVSVLLGNGDGAFQGARNFGVGSLPFSVAVGDFNGDGKSDLAVANLLGNSVSVLLGTGDGTFRTAQNVAVGSGPISVAVGDFNRDGKPDLVTANRNANSMSVLVGNGDGTFQAAQNFAVGSAPFSVAVGDFNGDGKPDLVTANEVGNSVSVLAGNADGTFQAAQNFAVGPSPSSVAVGDFNDDGRLDLATANVNSGYLSVLLNQIGTTTTVSGPTSSTYGQPVTYTAAITNGAAPVSVGTVTFLDGNTPISPALLLDANGQASFSIATLVPGSHTITASFSGTLGGAGTTGFGGSTATTGLTVSPAPLSAAAVNFSATAGVPFSGPVATFTNADPLGGAASYTAVIDWGDGTTTTGIITGTGTLTVSGSHTYADPGIEAVSVQISHNLGYTTTATVYPTANVTSLGQNVNSGLTGGIGFWHARNGQALIDSFNGGPNSTALSTWLATNFSNLYGAGAGANDLTGLTNAQVAAFYQSQFALPGLNLAAEVLATALNVYATTQSLGGTVGQAYGLTVSADGLGAYSFNVGDGGAAFGVTNNTTLNVYEVLRAVDQQAVYGVLYNGDDILQKEANDLFDALNKAGSIS